MWALLYSLRRQGWHFRRQVQLGHYYADFACHNPPIVIEVDGDTHGQVEGIRTDQLRDAYMRGRGFAVLRFSNNEVMQNPDRVFAVVSAHLARVSASGATPTPDPSPQGGGSREGGANP